MTVAFVHIRLGDIRYRNDPLHPAVRQHRHRPRVLLGHQLPCSLYGIIVVYACDHVEVYITDIRLHRAQIQRHLHSKVLEYELRFLVHDPRPAGDVIGIAALVPQLRIGYRRADRIGVRALVPYDKNFIFGMRVFVIHCYRISPTKNLCAVPSSALYASSGLQIVYHIYM